MKTSRQFKKIVKIITKNENQQKQFKNILQRFYNQLYIEELYKNDLHGPEHQDGVITHLEPDIPEREVKWAVGSITMNKASGGDGIPVE